MKSNAIIRICIYSLLIFVLLGLLIFVLFRPRWDVTTTELSAVSSDEQMISADEVQSIEVDWALGDITIQTGDTDAITVEERKSEDAEPMVVGMKDGELVVEYWHKKHFVSFGYNNPPKKDLLITVPKNWTARELEFDTASGTVNLTGLTANEVDYDGADVEFIIQDCNIGELDIDTASGDVKFNGTLNTLDLDGASTDFTGVFANTPNQIKMDGMSGSLDITLPADSGFRLNLDGMSCGFSSDFETTRNNGSHTAGNGACLIDVDGMSMDVNVRKGQ